MSRVRFQWNTRDYVYLALSILTGVFREPLAALVLAIYAMEQNGAHYLVVHPVSTNARDDRLRLYAVYVGAFVGLEIYFILGMTARNAFVRIF